MAIRSGFIKALGHSLMLGIGGALAATYPAGFVESQVVSGLTSPTCIAFGDQGRIFVSEQQGKIHMIKDGVRLAAPWHTVNVDFSEERGLTNIVADPDFAVNKFLWVYYTAKTPTVHQRLSRFTSAGDVVVPGSEVIILELPDLTGGIWHFGGNTSFGPDGKIYLTVGEYEKRTPAQDVNSPLGKVLRINRDGTFPSDNPFYASSTGWGRAVWALGFRHPFSGGMQPGTGKLFVNDVGQGTWEEVNEVVRGGNYGWPSVEGNAGTPPTQPGVYQPPLYTYLHSTDGCATIGGDFYNPPVAAFPSLYVGDYFTMDFCNGWIRRIRPDRSVVSFATGLSFPTRLRIHPDGSLYYISRGNRTGPILPGAGSLYRVHYFNDNLPHITGQPQDQSATVSQSVTFTVTATGPAPLAYQWQKDGADIPGATGSSYRIASVGPNDGGAYRVIVSNANGSETSRGAVLTLSTNLPPVANIFAPWEGYRWRPGETVAFSGTAIDPELGVLPASAFTWKVDYHHETHSHSSVAERTGITQGTFTISPLQTEPNTWYRVYLQVADPAGNQTTVFRDIFPANGASRNFFLSDTAWTSAVNGWGPVELDRSNGGQAAGDGRTISLDGQPLAKGLGVNSPSDIRFPLGGRCLLFMAEVGIDDEVGNLGTADFEVYGDGRLLHQTGIRSGGDRTMPITVLVDGISELQLVTTDGGDGPGSDHADWGNARLVCKHVEPLVDVALDFSNLNFEAIANGWGPVERDRSNGEAAAGDGRTLTLNGTTYAKGLGVHANSEIRYELAGQCSEFRADIGVDDEVGSSGSVRFEIWADAVRLYQSAILTGSSAKVTAVAALAGRQQLRLVVTDGGNGAGKDHANWAGAKLTCKSFPPVPSQRYVSDMTPVSSVNGWGPAEKDRSNGEAAAGDGKILTVDRLTYAKGMGVHANSDLRYSLAGTCHEFRADIGLDDEVGNSGSVAFQVWGDAVMLYQSPVLTGASPKTGVKVDVRGRSQLRLVVTDGGNGAGMDHADWADARLLCNP